MFRIFVADDHAVIRQGIRRALSDVVVVGEAATAQELLHRLPHHPCDVLLLDLALPDGSGIDLIPKIKAQCPRLRTIVFSMYSELEYVRRALAAGAAGYVLKTSPMKELREAIPRVISGQTYLSQSLNADDVVLNARRRPPKLLSSRELQVLQAVAEGQTMRAVADSLGLSSKTIATYRARLLEKLQLDSTSALIHYAVTHRAKKNRE